MDEKKGLSHTAYGGIKGDDYIPFIPAEKVIPEITVASIVTGCIFAIIFGAANTYLGLKVGLTISASIPAAILATGILKFILRRNNILEANVIQSIGAMGESIAGGLIFTLPAVIIWGMKLDLMTIVVVTALGGLLGVLFVVPLRRFLIVEEHGKLIYPEGMAAAEVLVNGSTGGKGFDTVLSGLGLGAVYKFLSGGLGLWVEKANWVIAPLQSTMFGVDVLASLLGVGYIVGLSAAIYMFSGAIVAWLGLIPLIKYVGANLSMPLFPSKDLINNMDAFQIWGSYIRYVGAGAVATGGFISLIKSSPTIYSSFKSALGGIGAKIDMSKRTEQDIPLTYIIAGAVLVFLLCWFLPMLQIGPIGSLLVVFFSFFFAVVSARIVGIIGVSNNPVSGMTIATLLLITSALRVTGYVGESGMLTAIVAGAIVCVAIAVAGGAGQNLKTTYILGGTPKYVEYGMYIGVLAAATLVGLVILLLNNIYGMGSNDIPAPQATLMSMVVKGVMTGQLPWTLVAIGAVLGIMCELLKIPVLAFALGLYLPIHLSAGILVGSLIRVIVENKFKENEEAKKVQTERGILLASGLVAGDALMGIVVAALAGLAININIGKYFTAISGSSITGAIIFLFLAFWFYFYTIKRDKA
jgi:putative OPT family oligopeptide transporter